jgi:hypothetical protein
MSCARCGASDTSPCDMPSKCTRRTAEQLKAESQAQTARQPHLDPSMTVRSASLRACPMRLSEGPPGRCVGPVCMAWRWIPVPPEVEKRHAEISVSRALPQLGYCGAGGIPLQHLDERVDPLLAELRVYAHFKARDGVG